MSSELSIEIVKQAGGAGVLRCTRQDGSTTWQKQTRHAQHFALHDLTHYAVETSLGYRNAFFGLIAQGWEIDDTTGKGRRGALPQEAIEAEQIVGLFDAERASGTLWNIEDFQQHAPRSLSEEEIRNIRALRSSLFQKWYATEPGGTLRLVFPAQ